MSINYKDSGVNIDAGNESVSRIKDNVKSTFSPSVITGLGGFGALYDLSHISNKYENPVLVQSIDGVGTKLMIAKMINKYDTIGMDIVNHCSNDIVAMGAKPFSFLDYVASDKLNPETIEIIVSGMVKACGANSISLVGGETAEMPGVYSHGEHDVVGSITGVVEKEKIISGNNITDGDIILGFASNGLHTNGYSLARKIFFEIAEYSATTTIPEFEKSVGETLLEPHTNYTRPVHSIINAGIEIKGIAHITGGGFYDNIERILPDTCVVEIKEGTWPILPVFEVMQKIGKIEKKEMYRTFNMGIGMILIINPDNKQRIFDEIDKYDEFQIYEIGKVTNMQNRVQIVN